MNTQTGSLTNRRVLAVLLLLTAFVIGVFFLVDQSIAIALVVGIGLAVGLRLLIRIVRNWVGFVLLLLGAAVVVIAVLAVLGPQIGNVFSSLVSVDITPSCDRIQFTAVDLTSGEFEVASPERTMRITSKDSGLLLKEVEFNAYQALKCSADSSSPMTVELVDLPRNVLFQVRGVNDLSSTSYLGTETITWQQTEVQVTFSYIPRGLRFLRQPLAFFYGIGSVGEGVMGVLGFLGTFAVSAIIQPTFEDMARDRLKKWFQSRGAGKAKDDKNTTGSESAEDASDGGTNK